MIGVYTIVPYKNLLIFLIYNSMILKLYFILKNYTFLQME